MYQQINQIHVDTESGQNLNVPQPDLTLGITHGRIVSSSLMKSKIWENRKIRGRGDRMTNALT